MVTILNIMISDIKYMYLLGRFGTLSGQIRIIITVLLTLILHVCYHTNCVHTLIHYCGISNVIHH